MSDFTPEWLWKRVQETELLAEMRPEHWNEGTPLEITHIIKEIFRRIAVKENWHYVFEKPNKHDMSAWVREDDSKQKALLLALETENKQDLKSIVHELKKLATSRAKLNIGARYYLHN